MSEFGVREKLDKPDIHPGAWVAPGAVVAGALVPEGMNIGPGIIVSGVPAKVRRETTDGDRARLLQGVKTYAALRDLHKSADGRGPRK